MRRMGRGLLVTEQLGQGVNAVTGDYSRGAAGFWIENGEIAHPVEEVTIAGNLRDHVPRHRRDRPRRRPPRIAPHRLDPDRPDDGRGPLVATPQRVAMGPPRSMGNPLVAWVRRLSDPLASANHAQRWIAELPSGDVLAIQKEALDLIAGFPGLAPRRRPRAGRGAAAHRQPARAGAHADHAPVHGELPEELERRVAPVARRVRPREGVHRRLPARAQGRLPARRQPPLARDPAVGAGAPRAPRGLDGRFRLFRYSHWIPAQWRDFHELYEFARMRGWQREQLVLGGGAFSQPGITLEQEYVQTLLLMRLDSGNFTPDQVEWVAKQLADWAPTLTLVPPPGEGAGFLVDLTGSQGLRRRDKPTVGGRSLYLDLAPVYARVVERMRWLPEQDDATPEPGDLPPREQRLLLMRLASLYGPEAIAQAPRAERFRTEAHGARRHRPAGAHARGRRDRPAARDRRACPASRRRTTRSRSWSTRPRTRRASPGASAARAGR